LTYLVPPKVNAASNGEAALTKMLPGAPLYAVQPESTVPATATANDSTAVATTIELAEDLTSTNIDEPERGAARKDTIADAIRGNNNSAANSIEGNASSTVSETSENSKEATMLESMAIAQLKWQVEWLGKELKKGGDAAPHAKAALESIVIRETSQRNESIHSATSVGDNVPLEMVAVNSENNTESGEDSDSAQAIIAEALLLLLHHESSVLARAATATAVTATTVSADDSLDSESLGINSTYSDSSGVVSASAGYEDTAAAVDTAVAAVVATAKRIATMVDSQGKSSLEILVKITILFPFFSTPPNSKCFFCLSIHLLLFTSSSLESGPYLAVVTLDEQHWRCISANAAPHL